MIRNSEFSLFGLLLFLAIFCLTAQPGLPSSFGQERFEVEITPQIIVANPVSPLIYGNFIEIGLGHQVDRMWGELLWNRSFEEISPYTPYVWDWLSRTPSDDLTKEAWWHSGYEEDKWYVDAANPDAEMRPRPFWGFRHGVQSVDIRNGSKTQWAVLAQDGIHLRKGLTYHFSGWMGTGQTAVEVAGEWIDGITDRALAEEALRRDLEIIDAYNKAHGRSIFLCNTEWISWQTVKEVLPGASLNLGEELEGTLQNREVRWGFAMTAVAELLLFQRLGGDFLFANFNNLANTWGQNVIECAKEGVWLSAAGRAIELMTRSPAAWLLAPSVKRGHPNIIFQAAWDRDKRNLVLQILNFGGKRVEGFFDFRALGFRAREAEASTLWADSLQAQNTLANPGAVRRADRTENLKGVAHFRWDIPPRSVGLVVLKPG